MNDDELKELFEPLRATGPSAEMRAANHDMALSATRVPPWWRRTIEVPLPVALATAAGLVIAVNWRTAASTPVVPTQPIPVVAPAPEPAPPVEDSYVESRQYLPGFGVVYREVSYQPQESR
jgi:hypothetical protein